jgi:hypothetical protein
VAVASKLCLPRAASTVQEYIRVTQTSPPATSSPRVQSTNSSSEARKKRRGGLISERSFTWSVPRFSIESPMTFCEAYCAATVFI